MPNRQNIENELNELDSRLPVQAPPMPYAVPAGYFEGLAGQVLDRIRREEASSELASIAPMLSTLPKQTPYTTPIGYFEQPISTPMTTAAPVVSIASRRWVRYAMGAAAMITGIFIWLQTGRVVPTGPATADAVIATYQQEIQGLDDRKKEQLSEFVAAGMTGQEAVQVDHTRSVQSSLLTDVSEQELTEFFEQSEYVTSSTSNE